MLKAIFSQSFWSNRQTVAVHALKRAVDRSVGSYFNQQVAILDLRPILLGTRRADNLFQAISDINAAQSLTKRLPTQADVESWVAQAKQLGGVVTY